ncbi:UNVERIFIED_CONTAM: hypothetical protein K2H54_037668 [Gekko kuhli]
MDQICIASLLEDEQNYDVRQHESDYAVLSHSREGMKDKEVDSDSSIFTYEIKNSEEPWTEVQTGSSSCESALDSLAQTLVKPVMTDLSLSFKPPRRMNAFSRKSVGVRQPIYRKPHVLHGRDGRNEAYSSESRTLILERRHTQKNVLQHRTYGSRALRLYSRKPFSTSQIKKSYQREMCHVKSDLDHSQFHPGFSTIHSITFLEKVISQLLIRMYLSLHTKYNSVCCTDMQQMNILFVNALVDEFKKAGVGVLQKAEEKTYFPPVDSQTINKVADSILREFGFQLASEKDKVSDVKTIAKRAAEITLVEILDYQLPPLLCRKLPKGVCGTVKSEDIIHRIEERFSFPRDKRQKKPPPAYITVLSQKYLERVINQIMAHFFQTSDTTTQKQDKWETSQADFVGLCSYMVDQVMKSIAKHKIWVAKKDDQCHLHSEKKIKSMVDAVYTKMLKKTGSQSLIQKDVKCHSTSLVDSITIFIIQVTKDTDPEHYAFSDEDVQNMADSLCSKILQNAGSLEAVQRDVKNNSNSLIERIAGFLIGEILKRHIQPFISRQAFPAWDTATTGNSMGRFDINRDFIKPLDLRPTAKEMRDGSSSSLFSEIISGLFSKTADTLSVIPLADSEEDPGDTAVRLAKTIPKTLTKSLLSVQEDPEEQLGFSPKVRTLVDRMPLYKDMPSDEDSSHTSPNHATTISFKEDAEYQLSSGRPSNLSEVKCFIQKNLFVGVADSNAKPSAPYTTVLSCQILETILDKLLGLIFSPSSSTSACSAQKEEPFGPGFYNRIAQIKKDIMATVLVQAVCISSYGDEREERFSDEAMKNMVESVYCNLLHEVLFQQPLPKDRESLSNFCVTKIACFIMNEMFKYHLQSLAAEEAPPCLSYHLSIFPHSLLEVMLNQLLEKIFSSPESPGKPIDFIDSNFTEMATTLKILSSPNIQAYSKDSHLSEEKMRARIIEQAYSKDSHLSEEKMRARIIEQVSALVLSVQLSNIKVIHCGEECSYFPQVTADKVIQISNTIYQKLIEKLGSEMEIFQAFQNKRHSLAEQLTPVIIKEISGYRFQPLFTGDTSSYLFSFLQADTIIDRVETLLSGSTTVIRLESDKIIQNFLSDMEPVKRKSESSDTQIPVISVLFLEEILSRFLTKTLVRQNDVASPEQKSLSKAEVNDIVDQLKSSVEKQMSKNKINLVSEDQPSLRPEYEETVNQVVHSVFSNVLENSGSQQKLYNDIRTSKMMFPEKVASIIVDEVSNYSIISPFNENIENETRSALEQDRIVSKVVAKMSPHAGPEKEPSMDLTTALPETAQEDSLEEMLVKSEEVPVKIGNKSLNIDPNLVADHLAVLSIKREPLEKLNRTCLSRTGVSLNDQQNENKKKERRPSLDFGGHLDVRPREKGALPRWWLARRVQNKECRRRSNHAQTRPWRFLLQCWGVVNFTSFEASYVLTPGCEEDDFMLGPKPGGDNHLLPSCDE